MADQKHRNDIYGDIDKGMEDAEPLIPAATVVLLRDSETGPEVLMLHRTAKVHFASMWVFPGGRIDPEDADKEGDPNTTARNAAARETLEEAGIQTKPEDFVLFAHWTPPASTPRRYQTWFFASALSHEQEIQTDGYEIQNHEWIKPGDALEKHAAGKIDLAPPTWITLYHLSKYSPTSAILDQFHSQPEKFYATHVAKRADGVRVAMWAGDAGYEATDADIEGDRHRLVMTENGFEFENTVEEY
jgi:8-oxo-dGTP pyrophosphatase MutT (NUDIX family)